MRRTIRRFWVLPLALAVVYGALLWPKTAAPVSVTLPEGPPVLIIDAGHGGEDGGAVSVSGQVESSINLSVALRLDALMGFVGVTSVLLRDSDTSLHDADASTVAEKKKSDLQNRVAQVNATENAVLISIHQNTYTDSGNHGAQVFYADESGSFVLAQTAQEALRLALDPGNARKPAKIPDSVYLMKHVTRPAILAECGFLSNPAEDKLLGTDAYQIKISLALAAAYWDVYYR